MNVVIVLWAVGLGGDPDLSLDVSLLRLASICSKLVCYAVKAITVVTWKIHISSKRYVLGESNTPFSFPLYGHIKIGRFEPTSKVGTPYLVCVMYVSTVPYVLLLNRHETAQNLFLVQVVP